MKSNTCPRLIRSWESEVLFFRGQKLSSSYRYIPGKKNNSSLCPGVLSHHQNALKVCAPAQKWTRDFPKSWRQNPGFVTLEKNPRVQTLRYLLGNTCETHVKYTWIDWTQIGNIWRYLRISIFFRMAQNVATLPKIGLLLENEHSICIRLQLTKVHLLFLII